MDNYIRAEWYEREFLSKNMMGSNSVIILDELSQSLPLKEGMKVFDLGCGNGLTSIFLAREFGVRVFAVDLWVSAADNYGRFTELGLDGEIIPVHADALSLPFADGYFDAVISIDAYHYFVNNDEYFPEKLKPMLKHNALVGLAFLGMKYEVHTRVPEDMKPFWGEDALAMWHSIDWWKPKLQNELMNFKIWELQCFDRAWEDWLSTNNP